MKVICSNAVLLALQITDELRSNKAHFYLGRGGGLPLDYSFTQF